MLIKEFSKKKKKEYVGLGIFEKRNKKKKEKKEYVGLIIFEKRKKNLGLGVFFCDGMSLFRS